jgi:hypothetical protein
MFRRNDFHIIKSEIKNEKSFLLNAPKKSFITFHFKILFDIYLEYIFLGILKK